MVERRYGKGGWEEYIMILHGATVAEELGRKLKRPGKLPRGFVMAMVCHGYGVCHGCGVRHGCGVFHGCGVCHRPLDRSAALSISYPWCSPGSPRERGAAVPVGIDKNVILRKLTMLRRVKLLGVELSLPELHGR